MKQRGATLFEYLLLVLAITAVLSGIYFTIDRNWATTAGVKKGEASKQAEWQAANDAEQARTTKRDKDAGDLVAATQKTAAAAQAKADLYRSKWNQAREEANREKVPLEVCTHDGVVLSWQFVREYDTAWTNERGEPVFADPARPASASLETGSPVTPEQLLNNHGENASRCSADRKQLNELTATIRILSKNWEAHQRR